MIIYESNLCFEFSEESEVVKFDDTSFYRNYFNKLPNAKGIDFIVNSQEKLLFMEVKNCLGHENDNRWRLSTDNRKVNTAPTSVDTTNRESLDVEVAKKIGMTFSCLMGSHSKKGNCLAAEELEEYFKASIDSKIFQDRKNVWILLLLEGNFASRTRSKKMVMKSLKDSIKTKLKWLNCKVDVVDLETYREAIFDFKVV